MPRSRATLTGLDGATVLEGNIPGVLLPPMKSVLLNYANCKRGYLCTVARV